MNKNYYCKVEKCNGLLLESPVVLLVYPADHMYQCLNCNHRYLRKDDTQELRSDYHQTRDLRFSDFQITTIHWALKTDNRPVFIRKANAAMMQSQNAIGEQDATGQRKES